MAEAVAQDAVSAISAILAAEKGEPQQQAAPEQEAPEQQPAAEQEAPAEQNTQVEGEDPPASEAKAEIPLDQLEAIELEVEVSGEGGKVTEKPTIKELKLGYMRQKDYQQKTAEVARQREELGEKTRQAIEGEVSRYQESLQTLQDLVLSAVAPELTNVNWDHLSANDPTEWVRLRNRADQVKQVLDSIQSKRQEADSKVKTEKSQARNEAARKAVEQLEKDIPGWSDDLYKTLMKAGTDYGFKPEEVGSWVDARAIRLLHDAHQFRKLQSGKPLAEKKVVVPPKVIKPGAAGPSQTQVRQAEAMSRLQKSGRVDDAAAVIRARLGV